MTYTSTGQLKTVTDADDYTTTYLYDSQDRLTTVQLPEWDDEPLFLQFAGRRDQIRRFGRNNATTYSYDAMNRETGSTDALERRDDSGLRLRR